MKLTDQACKNAKPKEKAYKLAYVVYVQAFILFDTFSQKSLLQVY